jgi:ubiquinone biosynthesis protein
MNIRKRKLKRTTKVLSVLTKYGFDEIFARSKIRNIIPENILEKNKRAKGALSLTVYHRIRMVLEELGPTYIKFGQMFSNRDDMLPPELIAELQKLQDEVPAEVINIREKITNELNIDPEEYFTLIEEKPLAAASVSQVFKAILKTGETVILKIKRDNIQEIIESDLLIMKSLVKQLEIYKADIKKLNLMQILETFEKSIHNELSLLNELSNIERFGKNFAKTSNICVPKTYRELSNNNILCMDFIDGIKVTDIEKLLQNGLDIKTVARQGMDLYMQQVLDHGFFHADPHAGNIFVLHDGRIAFIDFGAMVSLMPSDMEHLEDLILFLIWKNPEKFVSTIKKIAVDYSVKNEDRLQRGVFELIEMVSASSLENINVGKIIKQLKELLQENDVTLPDYLYLLMRGIILLEGIGQKLDPEINLIEILEPYTEEIISKKFSAKNIVAKGIDNIKSLAESMTALPEETLDLIRKVKNNELKITHEIAGMPEMKETLKKTFDSLVLAIIIAALSIGSAILVVADIAPKIYGIPVLGFLGFLISAILGTSIAVSMLRRK